MAWKVIRSLSVSFARAWNAVLPWKLPITDSPPQNHPQNVPKEQILLPKEIENLKEKGMDVILHCSDSSWGSAVVIDQWHRQRGFNNGQVHIGYHYVVLNGQLTPTKYHKFFNGHIETGRALDDDALFQWDEVAAATLGHNNCVQICLIGESGEFSIAQMKNTAILLRMLKEQYGSINVKQHSDFDPVNRPYCAGIPKGQMDVFNSL